MREQFAPMAAKYLSLVPTVTLRQGLPMRIFIEDDLYITPWEHSFAGVMPRD
jgi:type IV secretion system protein VirB10